MHLFRAATLISLASFAAAASAEVQSFFLFARSSLDKRGVCTVKEITPTSCQECFGAGSVNCLSDTCYNPSGRESCCSDGNYCTAGTYCTNKGCCPNGRSLDECGATVSLSVVPVPGSEPTSPASSESLSSSLQTKSSSVTVISDVTPTPTMPTLSSTPTSVSASTATPTSTTERTTTTATTTPSKPYDSAWDKWGSASTRTTSSITKLTDPAWNTWTAPDARTSTIISTSTDPTDPAWNPWNSDPSTPSPPSPPSPTLISTSHSTSTPNVVAFPIATYTGAASYNNNIPGGQGLVYAVLMVVGNLFYY